MNNKKNNAIREVDAAKLMIRVSNMHKRIIDRFGEEFGVPRSQHRLLMHIERMHGASSQSELARQLDVSAATVAVMLKKLENAGYIEKCTAENDCRNNEIKITESGLDVVRRTRRRFSEIDERFFGALSKDELEKFIEYMEKIAERAGEFEASTRDGAGKE